MTLAYYRLALCRNITTLLLNYCYYFRLRSNRRTSRVSSAPLRTFRDINLHFVINTVPLYTKICSLLICSVGNYSDFFTLLSQKTEYSIGRRGKWAITKFIIKHIVANFLHGSANHWFWLVDLISEETFAIIFFNWSCLFPQVKGLADHPLNQQYQKTSSVVSSTILHIIQLLPNKSSFLYAVYAVCSTQIHRTGGGSERYGLVHNFKIIFTPPLSIPCY